ncbi:MAG: hypothetical protein P8168_14290 [Deltaproteobacteria bacterium]
MNLKRWLSIILGLGLMLALSAPNALAWRNRPHPRSQHYRAFTPHPRGTAQGWHGPRQQWRHPQARASRWPGQRVQWRQPRGNAYGWHGQRSQRRHQQWQRQQRNVHRWAGQRTQWQRPRQPFAQGTRPEARQRQGPLVRQPRRPGSYSPIGYQGRAPNAYAAPGSFEHH